VPKGVVLLADVIPSFFTKLCAPYFIHAVPYRFRVLVFCTLSAVGMLLIALTPSYTDGGTIATKMAGVILASLSSGGGELSFLGLTHFYGPTSLAAWGSGTGAAGLVGAGAYALATTALGMPVPTALLASSFLPIIMILAFFVVLPKGPMRRASTYEPVPASGAAADDIEDAEREGQEEDEGLLDAGRKSGPSSRKASAVSFRANLRRASKLFIP
jgi:battenin